MSRRVLITGGAGFVGSTLGLGLAQRYPEWKITALDNLKRRGSELNLPRLTQGGVQFIHGDVRNVEDLPPSVLQPDLIIECSAEPSVLEGYTSPGYVLQTNLMATVNCLELARQTQADVIFLSTSRVYPIASLNALQFKVEDTHFHLLDHQDLPGVSAHGVSEEFSLDGARSLYGTTKLASELLITEFADAYGLRTLINRCSILTGPWQMGKVDQGVFAFWVASHYFQRPLQYLGFEGTGRQVRDCLHIQDFLDLIEIQIHRLDELKGQIFNVGGGVANAVSLSQTTQLCQEITGKVVPISLIPETRKGDVPIFITDSRKVISATAWQPQWDVVSTLTDIYNWIDQYKSSLGSILTSSALDRDGPS